MARSMSTYRRNMPDPIFDKIMDELKQALQEWFDENSSGDPVEERRAYARSMLDLNAYMSEQGYDTGKWQRFWQEQT